MSKLVKSEEIRTFLFDKFPLMTNNYQLRMSDMFYLLRPYKEMEKSIKSHSSKEISFILNIGECEEYSLYLRADIAKSRHIEASKGKMPNEERFTIALAESDGILNNKFYKDEPHTMNMEITEDWKVWYIENQSAVIYPYDLEHFNIYRIWM